MNDPYQRTLQTTSTERLAPTHVTVTHPNHPLTGLKLEIVTGQGNPSSTLFVRAPDESTLKIRKEWTDYGKSPGDEEPAEPSHLCSLEGLKQLALMLGSHQVAEEPTNIQESQ
ncbi:MAG: hypothetical protein JWM21_927 [Acidobacteria bacterium]|nr:hypothetical protein [Acidobacteriota bacterium]